MKHISSYENLDTYTVIEAQKNFDEIWDRILETGKPVRLTDEEGSPILILKPYKHEE